MAKLLKTDGDVIEVFPEHGKFFTLEELQGYVGGLIEMAYPADGNGVLVCNEEGLILQLPVNHRASDISGTVIPIVGDVLYCSEEELE